MELAKRFRGMLADLGLKPAQAAKLLHVSLRTVHNWNSGTHQIPVMAYKLLRMMRYMELPGQSWQGWHFSRGILITPEGRQICGNDGAWWSLLVGRAAGFTKLYQQQNAANLVKPDTLRASGPAAAGSVPDAGLVSYKTKLELSEIAWGQDGAIIEPWPTISDFPPLSMPTHENAAHALESASTPSCALPLMLTSGNQTAKLAEPQTSTPDIPGLRLTPLTVRLSLVSPASPANLASSPSPSAGNLPASSAKRANPESFELGKVAA